MGSGHIFNSSSPSASHTHAPILQQSLSHGQIHFLEQQFGILKLPPTTLDSLLEAIEQYPERAESLLHENGAGTSDDVFRNKKDSRVIGEYLLGFGASLGLSSSVPQGGVVPLDVSKLTGFLDDISPRAVIVPDVTFIGNKAQEKPNLQFAPHMEERTAISLTQLTPSYPRAALMYATLLNTRQWATNALRQLYTNLGGWQRDFIRTGTFAELRSYTTEQAGIALGLHNTTVSRLRTNRYVQIIPENGTEALVTTSALMPNQDAVFCYDVLPSLRATLERERAEFLRGGPCKAYSDRELSSMLEQERVFLSRRTISKYRARFGIMSAEERTAAYHKGQMPMIHIPSSLAELQQSSSSALQNQSSG